MEKIINVYKPKGFTSFGVVSLIKKALGANKVGHAGTLDPLAEGVLIVLIDEATKQQDSFMHQEKEYLAEIAFGFSTDTYDLEGQPTIYQGQLVVNEEVLKPLLPEFIGKISQTVPPYSAVKVEGKRLYSLSRKGSLEDVTLPVKEIEIKSIKMQKFEKRFVEKVGIELPVVTLDVVCSSGTYIRSLAHDLGKKLGCGATLVRLVRTRVGEFKVEDSIELKKITL